MADEPERPEKPFAVLLTGAIVAPLMVLCCAGPIVFASFFTSVAGWVAGIDLTVAVLIGLGAAVVTRSALRWHRKRQCAVGESGDERTTPGTTAPTATGSLAAIERRRPALGGQR